MNRSHIPAALATILAACSTQTGDTRLATAKIDTLPGGVIRVTNPGPTAWADTNGWRLVLERDIVPEEGTPGEIGSPRNVVAGSDGRIFLIQEKPATIKVYAPDGRWLRDIGREGDGPGEFRSGMFGIVRDTLFVQDASNSRFTTFTTGGDFVKAAPSQCCWSTSNFPVFADGTVGIMGPLDKEGGAFFITRLDGTVVDTIKLPVTPPDPSSSWTITRKQGNNTSMMSMGIPLQPANESAWLPERRKVAGRTSVYDLAIINLRGDTLRRFTAPTAPITITSAQRDSIFEAEIERIHKDWRESVREIARKGQIPTIWPRWSGIAVDGTSRIWVGRPGTKGATTLLDVFTPDGVLLGSVPAPDKEILGAYWAAERVYLRDETEEGLPRIRVFRIDTTARR